MDLMEYIPIIVILIVLAALRWETNQRFERRHRELCRHLERLRDG